MYKFRKNLLPTLHKLWILVYNILQYVKNRTKKFSICGKVSDNVVLENGINQNNNLTNKKSIHYMWEDSPIDVSTEVNFKWSIANKLRGPYQSD